MKTRKIQIKFILWVLLFITISPSCKDYLNVVPDNIPTVDHAFNKRYQAEGFLYGCYSFLPDFSNTQANPAFWAGDEAWVKNAPSETQWNYTNRRMSLIAKGAQGTVSPIANYWGSMQDNYDLRGGKSLFTAIRDCNIFIENIHKSIDLRDWERDQWIAEVKFLKAFYHFWLFRMYGPIPIIRENLPISADPSEVQIFRSPVDEVVNYIVSLLDEASVDLPLKIESVTENLGRATLPMALALKAQVLTYAASPLFNGNSDYADIVDNRGVSLFPHEYDAAKWEKAVAALQEAIDVCHETGFKLFDIAESEVAQYNLDEKTLAAMQVRGAVTERWNPEIVWGSTWIITNDIQRNCIPAFMPIHKTNNYFRCYAPTLRVVEQFYTENGVPVEEDKDWAGIDLYGLKEGNAKNKKYIEEGFETINLHFNREARFYGAVSFDGGTYYGNGILNDNKLRTVQFKYGAVGGYNEVNSSATGYLVKKLIHRLTVIQDNGGISYYQYTFPVIRLADLYLMYAEALNELKSTPDAEVYEYVDLVRDRTGLKGVVESWSEHSVEPNKPSTKEGMRDIIRRERMNELAFEGARFWDFRRWKIAEEYMNQPVRGLSMLGADAESFYQVQIISDLNFETKDYLWPIRQGNLMTNNNLVQNPGW